LAAEGRARRTGEKRHRLPPAESEQALGCQWLVMEEAGVIAPEEKSEQSLSLPAGGWNCVKESQVCGKLPAALIDEYVLGERFRSLKTLSANTRR